MSKVPLLDQACATTKVLVARNEFGITERGDRVRLVANNEHSILWFLVERALVSLNHTTGPTVAIKPHVENGAKFVRDDLGDANNFVEDILGGGTNRVGRITAEDGDGRVVANTKRRKVGTAEGIVVRQGKDTST